MMTVIDVNFVDTKQQDNMKIRLKVIKSRIVEKDYSLVQSNKLMSKDEMIEEIKEQHKFEDDKTQMNERIKQIKEC